MAEILNICTENTFCTNTSDTKCTTLTPALFLRLSDLFYSCKCTQAPVVKKTLYCEVIKNIFSNFETKMYKSDKSFSFFFQNHSQFLILIVLDLLYRSGSEKLPFTVLGFVCRQA